MVAAFWEKISAFMSERRKIPLAETDHFTHQLRTSNRL
jgi:hypothetical protein